MHVLFLSSALWYSTKFIYVESIVTRYQHYRGSLCTTLVFVNYRVLLLVTFLLRGC